MSVDAQIPFSVEWERVDPLTAVARLEGELELFTEPWLRADVRQLAGAGVRRIVLDIGRLSFIDSAGLSALISLRRHFPHPAVACLADSEARHMATLSQLQLTRLLPIYPTVAAALAENPLP